MSFLALEVGTLAPSGQPAAQTLIFIISLREAPAGDEKKQQQQRIVPSSSLSPTSNRRTSSNRPFPSCYSRLLSGVKLPRNNRTSLSPAASSPA
ncbi:unnamed protein product [Linum trigynum]|uniref:Uncharacterized protein n=1 Tax=Linum trigynum TaxID=586398 RepID=A0AAV2F979_9ROSI